MKSFSKALRISFWTIQLNQRRERIAATFSTAWMRLVAFAWGVKVGRGTQFHGSAILRRSSLAGTVSIGKHCSIISCPKRSSATSLYAKSKFKTMQGKIIIQDHVDLNGTSIVASTHTVQIGSHTLIGPNCCIMDADFHSVDTVDTQGKKRGSGIEKNKDVTIGKNVWIGAQCIILKGAQIGNNSVIAAGSIVNGPIPENVIAGGVPAKVIRQI